MVTECMERCACLSVSRHSLDRNSSELKMSTFRNCSWPLLPLYIETIEFLFLGLFRINFARNLKTSYNMKLIFSLFLFLSIKPFNHNLQYSFFQKEFLFFQQIKNNFYSSMRNPSLSISLDIKFLLN